MKHTVPYLWQKKNCVIDLVDDINDEVNYLHKLSDIVVNIMLVQQKAVHTEPNN